MEVRKEGRKLERKEANKEKRKVISEFIEISIRSGAASAEQKITKLTADCTS